MPSRKPCENNPNGSCVIMNTSTKSPWTFFLLVFALCLPIWLVGAVIGQQALPGIPVSSLVIVTPVLAALILVYKENGIAAMIDLLKRSFDFRRIKAKVWLVPIVLFWPGVMVMSYIPIFRYPPNRVCECQFRA